MERRILVAVFLSFLVLYAYQALVVPPPQPPPPQATSKPAAPAAPAASPEEPAPAPAISPSEPSPAAVVGDAAERQIIVDSPTVTATFTNRGGRVVRWQLKEYRDDQGQPVDLVPSAMPPDQPTPFALRVEDETMTQRLNTALYRVTGDTNGRFDPATGDSLVFEFEDASGLRARKEFRFDPGNYIVRFTASVATGDRELNPTVQIGRA